MILSSITRGLEFWSVNDTSIYKNSESNVFKNIRFSGEISNIWPNDLLGTNVYNLLLGLYKKRTNETQEVKMRGAFRKIYLHHQAKEPDDANIFYEKHH